MKNERKGGSLPVIAIAALAIGCCLLGPVLIGGAGAALGAWIGGLSVVETIALAGLVALVGYGVLRLRRAVRAAGDSADRPSSDEAGGRLQ